MIAIPMRQIDGLYTLILRLTKSEKRYFGLFAQLQGGNRLYWQLYELIQQEHGDDERIRTIFYGQHSASQFEAARKHLYAVLLKCLRNYRTDSDVETRLMTQIEEAQLLFSKGIIPLAIDGLRSVQQKAARHELLRIQQWALELELDYLMQREFLHESEESIVDRHEQLNTLLRQQVFNHQHSALNHLLLFRYFQQGQTRSSGDDARLNDLLLEEHRVNALPHRNSVESDKLHLHFQASYFLMTGQYADSLKMYHELNTLFEQQDRLGRQATSYYLYLIDGILMGLKSGRNFDTMHSFIMEIQRAAGQQSDKRYGLSELLTSYQLSIYLEQSQFPEALAMFIQEEATALPLTRSTVTHGRALLLFYGACVHFGVRDFGASLQLINQLLYLPSTALSRSLYTTVRLFELVIHVELGGEDYLPYKIRSIEWKLRAQQRLFRAERLVFQCLRQAGQTGWHHPDLSPIVSELKEVTSNTYDSHLNEFFNFTAWLTRKHDYQSSQPEIA